MIKKEYFKWSLMRQLRTYQFVGLLIAAVFLGCLCVPGANSGYEIFYMGGVRGIYNSAWLGAMAAALPVILIWLPGFYFLRSQISEDRRLRIGQIVAATPISKLQYLAAKLLSNFAVLLGLALLFTVAVVIMQLFRGESAAIHPADYLAPFLFLTLPYLFFLAALTILFDVVPALRGALGNILIFVIWVSLASLSIINPKSGLDLFGIGNLLEQMASGAKAVFPALPGGVSFGYYPMAGQPQTFVWDGMSWDSGFLLSRLIWLAAAIGALVLSALVFDRFKENEKQKKQRKAAVTVAKPLTVSRSLALSPIKRISGTSFFGMLRGELVIALKGHSVWWYLAACACIGLSPFVTAGEGERWVALIMLVPMSVWSQMGCREAQNHTKDLICSSCSLPAKWLASWLSGFIVSLIISAGMIFRFCQQGNVDGLLCWLMGATFIPTLAMVLSNISGSRKLFEGIYIALFYFGPLNGMHGFDFLGLVENNAAFYLLTTVALLLVGLGFSLAKEKHVIVSA